MGKKKQKFGGYEKKHIFARKRNSISSGISLKPMQSYT